MSDLTCDGFLGGRLQIWQPARGYRGGTDPVLLAAACPARAGEAVLDLGCGTGIAALCLGARVPSVVLTGLELNADHAGLARRNGGENAISFEVIEGDVARVPAALKAVSFDHVICNPPYFPRGGGTPAATASREAALREDVALSVWMDQAIRRLRPGGTLTFITRADRLGDLFAGCDGRVGKVEILPISGRIGGDAGRVILRATKGARAPLRLAPALVMHTGSGHDRDRNSHTARAESVLRRGEILEF